MTITEWEVRRGTYHDSLVLMQLQRALTGLPGVVDAGVVMATPANLDLLAASDLLPETVSTGPDDLLIVVRAEDESHAAAALGQVDSLLAQRRTTVTQDFRPHSLGVATRQLPEAHWVLVSVPGRYAAAVTREALELGRHVFLYSDNVALDDEISLKTSARERGLLLMGPDCGTAIIHGIGLGFANRVSPGPIGLVGASGTGLQAVTSQVHNLGGGISHALGTGSRDLSSKVGAMTAHQALDLLARDAETKIIVLISKPPASEVARDLLATAQAAGKPVIVDFIGYPAPARRIGNLHFATSLSETAEIAVQVLASDGSHQEQRSVTAPGYLRGLFSGGTLAYEMMLGLQATLSPLFSNAPMAECRLMEDPLHSQGHAIIDLGDEYFMVGRLHPMIDNDLRIRRLRQEAADPEVRMIVLDLVLGQGSHPNPGPELAPVLREIGETRPDIQLVTIVIGTDDDPQDAQAQVSTLSDAGARVFRTVTEAIDYVSMCFARPRVDDSSPVPLDSLALPLAAINVGLESFYETIVSQGAQAVQVDWRPPAGGDERLASILARMKK